jgi:formylglycine-generating enzyme required for sulfatase activity
MKKIIIALFALMVVFCGNLDLLEPENNDSIIRPEMIFVPAGSFDMGDNFDEGNSYERPVHTVNLDAYYIGKYEVTNTQYANFLNDVGKQSDGGPPWLDIYWSQIDSVGGSYVPKSGFEDHPVVAVSWHGAVTYCDWLTTKTGNTYRLPTEAEWEKAARGDTSKNAGLGHQRRYPWGDNIDSSYANYDDNYTTPVGYYDGSLRGSYQTNDGSSPYGAYDMAGNVFEWCSDWYSSSYYSTSPTTNPLGPVTGSYRVLRGGSWYYGPYSLRSAYRSPYYHPTYTNSHIGFRCVREY